MIDVYIKQTTAKLLIFHSKLRQRMFQQLKIYVPENFIFYLMSMRHNGKQCQGIFINEHRRVQGGGVRGS